jgi:hypothetical protein
MIAVFWMYYAVWRPLAVSYVFYESAPFNYVLGTEWFLAAVDKWWGVILWLLLGYVGFPIYIMVYLGSITVWFYIIAFVACAIYSIFDMLLVRILGTMHTIQDYIRSTYYWRAYEIIEMEEVERGE